MGDDVENGALGGQKRVSRPGQRAEDFRGADPGTIVGKEGGLGRAGPQPAAHLVQDDLNRDKPGDGARLPSDERRLRRHRPDGSSRGVT